MDLSKSTLSLDAPWCFLTGKGEMDALIRAHDWSRHPLGPPEGWHPTLKTTLAVVLTARTPMFLWWGKELFCFYNDAYRPSLGVEGKHPGILGLSAREAWPEIWTVIEPLIDQVMTGGGATWSEDQLIPIYRNGGMEDVYWTFSYSPVSDAEGRIQGVLVTCAETTQKVQTLKALKESERQLNMVIMQAPVAVAIFKGPTHKTWVVNERALELWGRTSAEVLGRPILEAMPELVEQGFAAVMAQVYAGDPFNALEFPVQLKRKGVLETAYINFVYEPLLDHKGEVDGFMAVGAEVTETVLARQRAEAGEAQFRLLADSMPQFVWTGDAQGNLNYFNRSVYDYSGLSEERVMQEGWLQIVHPEEREQNIASWMDAIANGTDFRFEHRFQRHDGAYRWQLSRAVPLRNADGTVHMWVGTSTDIHDIKQQDQQKDYFIGMASHELRNPLSALRGYLEVLQMDHGDSPDDLMKTSLRGMDRQVTSLTHLVNGLLDVSKMRAGAMELEFSSFSVGDVVRSVVEEMERVNPEHTIAYEEAEDTVVTADHARVAQVLTNLLTNAVKYAPGSKHITITSKVVELHVVISVRDRGIGISASDQKRVFERFYRVSGRDQRSFSGFGIGLTLAADIIRLHNGDIGVTSAPGEGSTFWFSLPI